MKTSAQSAGAFPGACLTQQHLEPSGRNSAIDKARCRNSPPQAPRLAQIIFFEL